MRVLLPLFFLTYFYFCVSCSPFGQNDPRLTDEQFVSFFVAMSKATNQYADAPVQLREAHLRLYREYSIAPAMLQATIAHYQEHPEKWIPILERIGKELRRTEDKVKSQNPNAKRMSNPKTP